MPAGIDDPEALLEETEDGRLLPACRQRKRSLDAEVDGNAAFAMRAVGRHPVGPQEAAVEGGDLGFQGFGPQVVLALVEPARAGVAGGDDREIAPEAERGDGVDFGRSEGPTQVEREPSITVDLQDGLRVVLPALGHGRVHTKSLSFVVASATAMATQASSPKVSRNDPCPCGSGKKFKNCCAVEETVEASGSFFRLAMFGMAVALVLVTVGMARELLTEDTGPKRVWSAEHGHWHAVGADPHASAEGGAEGEGGDGRVWSEEHGHWHNAGNAKLPGAPQPGKVWNEEHGHYHPADPIQRETVRGNHFEDQLKLEAERAAGNAP